MKQGILTIFLVACMALFIFGCGDEVDKLGDTIGDMTKVTVKGSVKDNNGQGVEGANVKLFKLTENTDFVEGGDIESQEGIINPEKVGQSSKTAAEATTLADGSFEIKDITIDAFLAYATKDNCTADFQGFDENTGALNLNTLLMPDITSGSTDITLDFTITCADPPPADSLNDDGSSKDSEPYTPPAPEPPTPSCDEMACNELGGACEGDECVIPEAQAECESDADCVAMLNIEGAFCTDAGDVDLAACNEPDPNEIIPPAEPQGWTLFKLTNHDGSSDLIDASAASETPYAIAAQSGVLRVYGEYDGEAETAYVMVQTGSQLCDAFMQPKIDFIEVPITEGKLSGGKGEFVEIPANGGYMKIQLTTSKTNGEGDRSMTVELGDKCQAPESPFVAILSWTIAENERADLDLHLWNEAGDQCFYASKSRDWGELDVDDRRGPGPEVFTAKPDFTGNLTVKVRHFSGTSPTEAKLRIIMFTEASGLVDNSYTFTLSKPREIFEAGLFVVE